MQIPVTQINAAGGAMTQLYDNTASGAIASWDVTGLATTYGALHILISGRTDTGGPTSTNIQVRFNNDTGANYDQQYLIGTQTTVSAGEGLGVTSAVICQVASSTAAAGNSGHYSIYLPEYGGTTFHKGFVSNGVWTVGTAAGNCLAIQYVGRWRSTAAINRITIFPVSGNFIAGSRLTIYGLL